MGPGVLTIPVHRQVTTIVAMMESFWGTMKIELLDRKKWSTRDELASTIFEWIECWYNPKRRHSSIGMHSPITFEVLHTQSVHTG